jgi:hypothetical protein
MAQDELLRDHPTHRHTDDVYTRQLEHVEELSRVVRHLVDAVRAGRLTAAADAAVVEDDGVIARGECGELKHPGARVRGQAHDQQQRLPIAMLFEIEVDVVRAVLMVTRNGRVICQAVVASTQWAS